MSSADRSAVGSARCSRRRLYADVDLDAKRHRWWPKRCSHKR